MLSNDQTKLAGKHPFYWLTVILAAVIFGSYLFAGSMIYRYGAYNSRLDWDYAIKNDQLYVIDVDPDGSAADKLAVGDQIISINGDTRIRQDGIKLKFYQITDHDHYTIAVKRDQQELQFTLPFPHTPSRNNGNYLRFTGFSVTVLLYLMAIMIGLSRPQERVAQLCCLAFFSKAIGGLVFNTNYVSIFLQPNEFKILVGIALVLPPAFSVALFYHFFYSFPPGVRPGQFWNLIKYLHYLLAAVVTVMSLISQFPVFALCSSIDDALACYSRYYSVLKYTNDMNLAITVFSLFAGAAVIIRNYRQATDLAQARRARWVCFGSLAGFLPYTIRTMAGFLGNLLGVSLIKSVGPLLLLSLAIIPITIGYAVVKQNLFDIKVVIRRGTQYLFAKGVLIAILALELLSLVTTILRKPDLTIGQILSPRSSYLYLIFITVLSLVWRARVTNWIDRRFFREAYDQERLMLELIDQMKQLDSMAAVSKQVSEQLATALHPKAIYTFYCQDQSDNLTLIHSSRELAHQAAISQQQQLFSILKAAEQEIELTSLTKLPIVELQWLQALEVSLIVPMRGSDHHLVGALLLGEKQSEEPYSQKDLKLLKAIANQIAMVHENILLKGYISKERQAQRELLVRFENQNINLVKECPSCGSCYDSSVEICEKDRANLTISLPVERVIDNKYSLTRLLGKGGMGAVYQAADLRLDRSVALKIMLGKMFGDQEALRRFEREARTSARLNHPNIISVYDYGRLTTEGAYLVMELVRGESLRAKMSKPVRFNSEQLADWFDQILAGVKAAHQSGIIHRDLKPENILVADTGEGGSVVKVLDFGLAKFKDADLSDSNNLTTPGTVMGTFGYMSLEQLEGKTVDERTDIFALAVIAAEVLVGHRPFQGKKLSELMTSMLRDRFSLPGDTNESNRLGEVLRRGLDKDRNRRFASVAEFQQELIPALRNYAVTIATARVENQETLRINPESSSLSSPATLIRPTVDNEESSQ